MDLVTAEKLMEKVNATSRLLAELSQMVDALDEPERSAIMGGVGKTMGELYLQVIYPIGVQHPSLNPVNSTDASR